MRERKFEKALGDLKKTKIGLFLSEDQFIEGVLLAVQQDHVVMDVNQNVFYIERQHIKALSKNAKDFNESSKLVPYLDRKYFPEILDVLKYNWVTVNGAGKQKLFGVLCRISEDHIILINKEELLYVPKSCISTIYSEMTNNQIIKANDREQLASRKTDISAMNEEIEETELHHAEITHGSFLQLEDETEEASDFALIEEEKELSHTLVGEVLGIQDEEHIIGVMDLGEILMENPLDRIEIEVLDSQNVIVHDNEHPTEVEYQEFIESIPHNHIEETLSFSEPLGYERDFFLTFWKTEYHDQHAVNSLHTEVEEEQSPVLEETLIQMKSIPEEIESSTPLISNHHPIHELENASQSELIDKELEPSDKTDTLITFRRMSPKEVYEMLEKQYFSLAKQAAGYSHQLGKHPDRPESVIRPHEWQYVSLMNHAAKMYRQLRDR